VPEPANEDAPLFEIMSPEANGMVWLKLNKDNGSIQYANLGPIERVAEVLRQWLASYDEGARSS
jgi:hypothetical protein